MVKPTGHEKREDKRRFRVAIVGFGYIGRRIAAQIQDAKLYSYDLSPPVETAFNHSDIQSFN